MKKLLFLLVFLCGTLSSIAPVHAQDEMTEAEKAEMEASTVKPKQRPKPKTSYWGVSAGYYNNGLSVDLTSTIKVDMSGTSFGIGGFYEYFLKPRWSMHLDVGLKPFNVEGTAIAALCSSSTDCSLKINYLGADALARFHILTGKWSPWIGGGGSFQMAMSKTNNVVDDSKIGFASSIIISLGLDWNITPRSKIPIMFNYYNYSAGTNAVTRQYSLMFGYGF